MEDKLNSQKKNKKYYHHVQKIHYIVQMFKP